MLSGYDEFSDLPEGELLRVYSLNEIATEKVIALADRARNEPRDLYDLWYLTTQEGVHLAELIDAIGEKLSFCGKPFEGLAEEILQKEARLDALWSKRLAYQMAQLPEFEEVFRAVRREIRQGGLP